MPMVFAPILLIGFFAGATESSGPLGTQKPDFKFDYKAHLLRLMQSIADGKSDEAVDLVDSHAFEKYTMEQREALKITFEQIMGNAGKCFGTEVLGYKRLTSRLYRLYGVAHYEKATITYTLLYGKTHDDEWKMQTYAYTTDLDVLDKNTRFIPSNGNPDFVLVGQARLQGLIQLIVAGKCDQAVELLDNHSWGKNTPEGCVNLKITFTNLHRSAGKCSGIEALGYKQLTPRMYKVYAASHHEKTTMLYTLHFTKTNDGDWKIRHINFTNKVEDFEKVMQSSSLEATP